MDGTENHRESPAGNHSLRPRRPRWAGVVNWILTHPIPRLIIPPVVVITLFAVLAFPLMQDLQHLSEDDLVQVQAPPSDGSHDGHLIVSIKNVNPNNGIASVDVTWVTDDITSKKVEIWLASGGVTLRGGKVTYDKDIELHRVPIVMENPSIFVWEDTKRATFKVQNAELKIEQRTQGYFYPFDRYVIEFSFAVIDEQQRLIHPAIWCELDDPRFVHDHPGPMITHGEDTQPLRNSLRVELDRPTYQKIFLGVSLMMGLGCVLWSLYKITYTSIDAMESLSLLAFDLTVLLAVPQLRGVFVPSNLQYAPLFDFFVVLIWTLGLLALGVNIIRHDIVLRLRKLAAAEPVEDSTP